MLLLVLVRERDKLESPPIIELKDILLNEPLSLEANSGGLSCAEFVRSRALRISCDACWSNCSGATLGEAEVSKEVDVDERFGVVGLERVGRES